MTEPVLRIALTVNDRTRPLLDGRVPVEGYRLDLVTGEPEELFRRALREQPFDITELSLSSYLVVNARGESPYVAVPAFPSRAFRHSAVYIRRDRGIEGPEDLRGKVLGVPEFQQTAALWVRGLLSDQHGISPSSVIWRSGGMEVSGERERVRIRVRDGIDLAPIGRGETLSGLLHTGALDGIVSPRPPRCFLESHPHVGRLWPDYRAQEERFYRATALFPIMHLVAVRKGLAEEDPRLSRRILDAFRAAKDLAIADLEQTNFLRIALPWVADDLATVRKLMGPDFWPYGFAPNRKELEAVVRWSFEEGLSERLVDPVELFHPSTLD